MSRGFRKFDSLMRLESLRWSEEAENVLYYYIMPHLCKSKPGGVIDFASGSGPTSGLSWVWSALRCDRLFATGERWNGPQSMQQGCGRTPQPKQSQRWSKIPKALHLSSHAFWTRNDKDVVQILPCASIRPTSTSLCKTWSTEPGSWSENTRRLRRTNEKEWETMKNICLKALNLPAELRR